MYFTPLYLNPLLETRGNNRGMPPLGHYGSTSWKTGRTIIIKVANDFNNAPQVVIFVFKHD